MGKIKSGVALTQDFAFEATGNDPIEILEVRPSCGCVSPALPQKVIAPGDKATMTLKVRTLGEAEGAHRWYVYVLYRQGSEQRQVALDLVADVYTEIFLQPPQLHIHAGGPLAQEIRLIDTRPQPLSVVAIRPSAPFLRAAPGKGFRDAAGSWVIPIAVDLVGGLPDGKTTARLDIETDDSAYKVLPVEVTVNRPPTARYNAAPAEVKWAGIKGQPLATRLVLIRDARDEQVTVEEVKSDHPAVRCFWAKGPGEMATVRIQIDAGKLAEDGLLETAVTVRVGGSQPQTITIPVTCKLE